MRRVVIVGLVAVAATGAWWLAEDGDLRRNLSQFGDGDPRSGSRPACTELGRRRRQGRRIRLEERDLKRTVGGNKVAPDPPAPQ